MPCPDAVSWCCAPVPRPDAVPWCRAPEQCPSAKPWCSAQLSRPGAVPWCHAPLPRPGAVPRCHAQVPRPSAGSNRSNSCTAPPAVGAQGRLAVGFLNYSCTTYRHMLPVLHEKHISLVQDKKLNGRQEVVVLVLLPANTSSPKPSLTKGQYLVISHYAHVNQFA